MARMVTLAVRLDIFKTWHSLVYTLSVACMHSQVDKTASVGIWTRPIFMSESLNHLLKWFIQKHIGSAVVLFGN